MDLSLSVLRPRLLLACTHCCDDRGGDAACSGAARVPGPTEVTVCTGLALAAAECKDAKRLESLLWSASRG
jgi:hypothetical protein